MNPSRDFASSEQWPGFPRQTSLSNSCTNIPTNTPYQRIDGISSYPIMLSSLDTLYYIYPCTLFCALWGVQGIQYYYERKQRLQSISAAIKPIQATKEPKRIYSWLLRILQSILSLLFLSSITIAVYEAATNRGKHGLSRLFSSTYLVCINCLIY